MKPPVLSTFVMCLVLIAASTVFGQEFGSTFGSGEALTETVSKKVEPEAKSYDDMDIEELGEVIRKLQQELKNHIRSESGGAITDGPILDPQQANQLREQLFKANTALRKKGDKIREAERDKWHGHLAEVTTRLDEMKRERFGILEKFYQVTKAKYEGGTVGIDIALAAEADLADAEFDLHGRESLKTRMLRLRQWQERLDTAMANDENLEEDYLKVKVRFLKTYIEYLKGTEENYREILKRYQ